VTTLIQYKKFISLYLGIVLISYPSLTITNSNYGILLLIGLFLVLISLLFNRDKFNFLKKEKIFLFSFVAFFLLILTNIVFFNVNIRELDSYSRFLLVIPFYLYFRSSRISPNWLIFGILLAAFLFGINVTAKTIFSYSIFDFNKHSGMISLYGSIFGVTCLFLAGSYRNIVFVYAFLIAGILGIATSFFSGGRGTWIAAIMTIFFMFFWNPMRWRELEKALLTALFFSVLALSFAVPQSGVKNKFDLAVNGVKEYIKKNNESSKLGKSVDLDLNQGLSAITRLEMWKSALIISKDSPIFGVGQGNFKKLNNDLIDAGIIHNSIKTFNHPHGQYLSVLVQQGIIGVIVLLNLLLTPIFLILRKNSSTFEIPQSILRLYIVITVVSVHYIGYSLTNAVFAHQNMTLLYCFFLATSFGLLKSESDRINAKNVAKSKTS